jgi:hypothetical protein
MAALLVSAFHKSIQLSTSSAASGAQNRSIQHNREEERLPGQTRPSERKYRLRRGRPQFVL